MTGLKKLAGAYMVGLGVVVAVFFIINPFLVEFFEVISVWYVLDVLMIIGLALALAFNYASKRADGRERDPYAAITRRYVAVNAAFYITVGVTILFLHSWFSLLAFGEKSLDGNHQAWVIWAVVDVMLPVTMGITGCRLWHEASQP